MVSNNPLKFFESLEINDQFKLISGVTFQIKVNRDEDVSQRIYKKISEGVAIHIATNEEIQISGNTPVRSLMV
jgi:hypothetical protein